MPLIKAHASQTMRGDGLKLFRMFMRSENPLRFWGMNSSFMGIFYKLIRKHIRFHTYFEFRIIFFCFQRYQWAGEGLFEEELSRKLETGLCTTKENHEREISGPL
jgi:hypothetical protein